MISIKKNQQLLSWTQITEKLHLIESQQALNDLINEWIRPNKKTILAFVNAHAMNLAYKSSAFANDLIKADYLLRDGSGMAIFLKRLHKSPGLNLNGTDLIPRIVANCKVEKIALIGTQSPYLEQAEHALQKSMTSEKRVVTLNGFQELHTYVSFCLEHKPEIIVLGMGMPKQEHVAQVLKHELNHHCLIICGGAIIDFWGGKVSRAPSLIRKVNMEWIYRLFLEPKRLFKRYVIGNPVFLLRCKRYIKQFGKR